MARESFVFIQLPGEMTPTVAGLFTHEDAITPALGKFVYGKSYLSNARAVPLDPVALPLREVEFTTTLTEGFFGAIRDALPDDWGRHVIQRLYGEQSRTTFDLLELPSADRFGALSFGKSSKGPDPEPVLGTLSALTGEVMAALDKIDRDVALSDAEKRAAVAMGAGTHAGGARPKLTLRDEDGIWLVKLNRFDDKVNNVRVEAAMHDLAARCGIDVPPHRVESMGDKDALLVRRFDRDMNGKGTLKHRTVSAATVFRADEEYARANFTGSYMRLARELSRWSVEVTRDRHELFRRMAFNCLTGIVDDHERNHALVARDDHFRLAPAFDLSPTRPTTRRRRQALAIGGDGDEATRENLLSAVDQFNLKRAGAIEIIESVKATIIADWREAFAAQHVSSRDIDYLSPCFDHDYFEHG